VTVANSLGRVAAVVFGQGVGIVVVVVIPAALRRRAPRQQQGQARDDEASHFFFPSREADPSGDRRCPSDGRDARRSRWPPALEPMRAPRKAVCKQDCPKCRNIRPVPPVTSHYVDVMMALPLFATTQRCRGRDNSYQ
jgi:hypothetical protein